MSREIKFRGRRVGSGEWDYGDLVTEVDGNGNVIRMFIHNRLSHISGPSYPLTSFVVIHEVDPKTVSQFTGFKDKNGVEIYESDVIRCALMFEGTSLPHMGEAVWDNEHGCWATKNLAGLTPFLKHELIAGREIIGNVHQHPELLK